MPIFNDTLLTNKGFEMANKAANGQAAFTITKAVASETDYNSKNEQELRTLTKLDNEVDGLIKGVINESSKVTGVKTSFSNEPKPTGYTANTVGLYAKDSKTGEEFLYSVTTASVGQVIPETSNNVFSGFELTIYIVVGNSKSLTVTLSRSGEATIDYVNQEVSKAKDDINELLKNKADNTAVNNLQSKVDNFTIHDSYTDGNDMYAMPMGIWRMNNENMINTPYGDHTTIIGTVINYGWYTTYVDKTGNTYITSPNSMGWQQYASHKSVKDGFEYHGKWDISLAEFRHALTGVYQLDPANTDAQSALVGWDGYGAALVYNNGVDTYVTIYGHNGLQWNNHTIDDVFGAWVPLPTKDDISNLQTQINAANNNAFKLHGDWTDSFLKLNTATDGYWHIGGNSKDAPAGFSGWGVAIVYHNFGDCFVTLWDNANNQWRNHLGNGSWNGWKQF